MVKQGYVSNFSLPRGYACNYLIHCSKEDITSVFYIFMFLVVYFNTFICLK